ncbi:hypothetical protein DFH09DRAFT_1416132 [Mycena vulgaris]|nr:hypothetical protein DFH09DRAFT_1416132 [Mycena vulgaris]
MVPGLLRPPLPCQFASPHVPAARFPLALHAQPPDPFLLEGHVRRAREKRILVPLPGAVPGAACRSTPPEQPPGFLLEHRRRRPTRDPTPSTRRAPREGQPAPQRAAACRNAICVVVHFAAAPVARTRVSARQRETRWLCAHQSPPRSGPRVRPGSGHISWYGVAPARSSGWGFTHTACWRQAGMHQVSLTTALDSVSAQPITAPRARTTLPRHSARIHSLRAPPDSSLVGAYCMVTHVALPIPGVRVYTQRPQASVPVAAPMLYFAPQSRLHAGFSPVPCKSRARVQ